MLGGGGIKKATMKKILIRIFSLPATVSITIITVTGLILGIILIEFLLTGN